MKEAYQIVVSYAEGDNAASNNEKSWITDFCKFLNILTNRLSNLEIKVVPFKELKDNTELNNAICVPLLSPAYLSDAKCKKELSAFAENGLSIYRVQKLPVAHKDVPKEVSNKMSYKFYERSFEVESGYIQYSASSSSKNYWLKLVDLAYDITRKIALADKKASSSSGNVVYLAETSFDQDASRDTLRRELQRYGHTVLPDHPLSENPATLKSEVEGYLEKCSIAIHIVGAHYGSALNGSDQSLVEIQNNIAGEFAQKKLTKDGSRFKRYLWSPPYMKPADEKQMLYLDRLKEEVDKSVNAEIIQVPLEILKSIVEKNLMKFEKTKKVDNMDSKSDSGKTMVYLISDKDDMKDVETLKTRLEKENIEVATPSFEGNQLELLNEHRRNLVNADAVFIYSNHSNRHWLTSKINDLIKSPGFGRTKPFKVQAICAPNNSANSGGYGEFSDIIALDKLDDQSMNSFLVKLK